MLGIEAVLASVTAAVMGLAVGVVFAWAAVATIPNLVFTVPWSRLALCALAAGVLGLLASLVPARRAARLSPVAALATE
jgi:putative ABC transport system permease protein